MPEIPKTTPKRVRDKAKKKISDDKYKQTHRKELIVKHKAYNDTHKKDFKTFYEDNKDEILLKRKTWYQLNKKKIEERRIKRQYGLTISEYNKLKKKQNGKCAICSKKKKLGLDHNHKTGRVRKFLCSDCNLGLGKFKDSLPHLKQAVKYLETHIK